MKKIIYSISILAVTGIMQSCSKNVDRAAKKIVLNTGLASGTEYVLDLKPYGDADDVATITKQGTVYSTSEIVNATGTFAPVYHYSSSAKTSATDQVILSVTEGNSGERGSRHGCDSTTITINFTIK